MFFFAEIEAPIVASYNYWQEFIHMLLTLGFVLTLVIFTVWLLKRIMASRVKHLNQNTSIKILEKRTLHQKAALYLISVNEKQLLISDSSAGIQMICECPEVPLPSETIESMEPLKTFNLAEKFKKYFVKNG